MKRWVFRAALLAVLLAIGFWGWHVWFPGPEQIIRRRLNELAQMASVNANEAPLKKLAIAQGLAGYFTREVQVTVDVPGRSPVYLNGQEEIREAALSARSTGLSFTVEFLDVDIKLAPDRQSAVVELTAKASIPGERMPQVQELKVGFKKANRDWLVNNVETVRTLH